MMRSELTGRLLVVGRDPANVAQVLGLEPAIAWREGDAVPNAPLARRKEDVWGIESKASKTDDLDTHVRDLLEQLAGRLDLLATLGAAVRVVVSVWSIGGGRPELVLTPETVASLSKVKAEFGIDLYVVDA